MSLTHRSLSFVSTIDIIVPVKLGLGQHILRPPLLACIAILAPIPFECLTDVLKGQLADTEADRNPDGRLCVVANLHGPVPDIANVTDTSTATDREARAGNCATRIHFGQEAIV